LEKINKRRKVQKLFFEYSEERTGKVYTGYYKRNTSITKEALRSRAKNKNLLQTSYSNT